MYVCMIYRIAIPVSSVETKVSDAIVSVVLVQELESGIIATEEFTYFEQSIFWVMYALSTNVSLTKGFKGVGSLPFPSPICTNIHLFIQLDVQC